MKISIILILSYLSISIYGQAHIEIFVTSKNNLKIEGAIIQELEMESFYNTDKSGKCLLKIPLEKSKLYLKVFANGYESKDTILEIPNSKMVHISLQSSIILDEVIISAPISLQRKTAYIFPLSKIKNTPVLFGEPDVFRSLQTLPGINFGYEGTSDMIVRGGNIGENQILIDGMPSYISSHLLGLISPFDADIVKNIKVFKGGFPSQYGGKLSSVIDIKTKEFEDMNKLLSIRIGILSNAIHYTDKINEKIKFTFSGRRTILDLVSKGVSAIAGKNVKVIPFFYDFHSKLSIKLSPHSFMNFSFISNKDYFINENTKSIIKSTWSTPSVTINYNYSIKHFKTSTSFLKSSYNYEHFEKNKSIDSLTTKLLYSTKNSLYSFNTKMQYIINDNLSINFGASNEIQNYKIKFYRQIYLVQLDSINKFGNYLHSYFSLNNENERFNSDIGLHFITFPKNNFKTYIEPRLYLSYRFSRHKIYGALSIMHQTDHLIANRSIGNYLKTWIPADSINLPSNSKEYSFGYEYSDNNFQISTNIFYKKRESLIHPREGDLLFITSKNIDNLLTNGTGKAYGLELSYFSKIGTNTTINISYTYSKSILYFKKLNQGKEFYDYFDRRHSLFIGFSHKFNKKWEINSTFTFNSGHPFTYIEGIYPLPEYDENSGFNLDSDIVFHLSGINNRRLPVYHRLDISVNYNFLIKNKISKMSFGIYNVYARINPFFVRTNVVTTSVAVNNHIAREHLKSIKYEITSYFNFIPFVNLQINFF